MSHPIAKSDFLEMTLPFGRNIKPVSGAALLVVAFSFAMI